LRHLDRVLVVTHEEVDVIALLPAITCLHVGAEFLERRADVRPAVRIIDGGGQIEAWSLGHALHPCKSHVGNLTYVGKRRVAGGNTVTRNRRARRLTPVRGDTRSAAARLVLEGQGVLAIGSAPSKYNSAGE